MRQELGLHTVLGVSNISFGLPGRENLTAAFLTQAMAMGLDLPIVNPNLKSVMDAIACHKALSGEDAGCEAYITRFAPTQAEKKAAPQQEKRTLEEAVLKGLGEEVKERTLEALGTLTELEVVDKLLIPALDVVGEQYEKEKIFLPQMISAANAASMGFEVVKQSLAAKGQGGQSKGKIVIATVQGDIHDIGKNIVKIVLENYGYTVIDLGRDVPVETVVETAMREKPGIVGLSALMTTTVPAMAETIAALKAAGYPGKTMVGGAVLTAEYAKKIGADYYAADAKQSADIAKAVLG